MCITDTVSREKYIMNGEPLTRPSSVVFTKLVLIVRFAKQHHTWQGSKAVLMEATVPGAQVALGYHVWAWNPCSWRCITWGSAVGCTCRRVEQQSFQWVERSHALSDKPTRKQRSKGETKWPEQMEAVQSCTCCCAVSDTAVCISYPTKNLIHLTVTICN